MQAGRAQILDVDARNDIPSPGQATLQSTLNLARGTDLENQLINPANGAVSGSAYHTDAGYHATGKVFVRKHVLLVKAPLADFGFGPGTKLFSVSPYSMAGPSESTELTVLLLMRVVDAAEPFDTQL